MSEDLKGNAPKFGVDCSDRYVDSYVSEHLNESSLEYRLGYAGQIILNGLLKEEYTLLDVGCGTAGYFGFYDKAKEICGIDYSAKMIEKAKELTALKGIKHCSFFTSTFADFSETKKYDAIMLGVYGQYLPITLDVLQKTFSLLNNSGLVVFSIASENEISLKISFKKVIKRVIGKKDGEMGGDSFVQLLTQFKDIKVIYQMTNKTSIFFIIQKINL
jgi:predicted TPR repeat methyltransferase